MDQGIYLCNECGKRFTKKKSWVAHRTRHERRKQGIRFPCEVCGVIFLDKKNVEIHKRKVHLNDFQYCCEQCGRAFVCKGHLNRHVKMSHEEQEPTLFCCDFKGCNESFSNKATYRYHLLKHEQKIYSCEFCDKIFKHPYRLKIHVKIHHGNQPKKMFQCKFCDLQVTTKLSLRDHIRTHTGEKPFVCEQCGQNFTTNQQLKTHIVVHTKEKPFACTICDKKFTQRGTLSAHIKTTHAKIETKSYLKQDQNLIAFKIVQIKDILMVRQQDIVPQADIAIERFQEKHPVVEKENFVCTQCGKSFNKKKYLNAHVNDVHNWTLVTSCTECGKSFTSKRGLKKHIDTFHREIVSNFTCEICGEIYPTKVLMESHKHTIHMKNFNVFCDICGKGFIYETALKQHKLKQHKKVSHGDGVPIMTCKEEGCEKTFSTTSGLKYHIRAEHTQDKPELICGQCGETFDNPYKFNRHLRFHKNGRPIFKCSICQKVLTSKVSLDAHVRTHTGEKPFVCEKCGIGFNRMAILRNHRVVHTKEKPYACKFCDKKYTQRSPLIRHIHQVHPESVEKE